MTARFLYGPWLALFNLALGLGFAGCTAANSARNNCARPIELLGPEIDVATFRQRILLGYSAVTHLHAEVRLVSFGPQGRLRGRADVDLGRPDRLRYTLYGPQGGPLIVLACDGAKLRGVDMQTRRFVSGPANASQFDAWLAPLQLHLDARGFVRLLLGELDVPPEAQWAPGAPPGMWALSWQLDAGQRIWAAFGKEDAKMRMARVCRGADVHTQVRIEARGAAGTPTRLHIEQNVADAASKEHIELSLRDVDTATAERQDAYSLSPPQGFAVVESAGEL